MTSKATDFLRDVSDPRSHSSDFCLFIYLFIYYSPSFNPLQGTRPTGCGSSQDTLDSYNKSIT